MTRLLDVQDLAVALPAAGGGTVPVQPAHLRAPAHQHPLHLGKIAESVKQRLGRDVGILSGGKFHRKPSAEGEKGSLL